MDCVFCKIIEKKIPAKIVAQSETTIAFADLSPQAPIHHLVIPKKHFSSLNDIPDNEREKTIAALYQLADEMARELGFRQQGYRTVINNQALAGQTVFHLHMHVLSGGQLGGRFGQS